MMAGVVIDASAVLAVLLNEPTRAALIAATQELSLVGAMSLPWEVGNALVAGARRARLTPSEVHEAWASYETVPVRLVSTDVGRALDAALQAGLHAYDGYVLEAARAERLPLLTLDAALARAALRLGVTLMELA